MKHVSKLEFIDILSKLKGAHPISFSARVAVEMRKKNNPYAEAGVFKLRKIFAFTGFDYSNSVNKQLEREDKIADFQSKERTWGERICGALVKDKDKYYLVAKVERARSPVYFYNDNGINRIINEDKIKEFLPIIKPTAQGLEKEVIYRNYAIDNLISVSLNKEKYKIV